MDAAVKSLFLFSSVLYLLFLIKEPLSTSPPQRSHTSQPLQRGRILMKYNVDHVPLIFPSR